MSTLITAPIARFDNRVRLAATLLRAAPRIEHLVVGAMILASAAAAWPFAGALFPAVAIPALLALAALMRHHLDGLGARRDALTAAGADPADTLVIQLAGPLGATGAGAVAGLGAAVGTGRPASHAAVPIAVGLLAAFLVRRAWLGAPALAAGSLAALATAALLRASALPGTPHPEARSRVGVHLHHAAASASTSSTAWPVALAAVLTLAAVQLGIARRRQLRALARGVTAAAARRMIVRSGA